VRKLGMALFSGTLCASFERWHLGLRLEFKGLVNLRISSVSQSHAVMNSPFLDAVIRAADGARSLLSLLLHEVDRVVDIGDEVRLPGVPPQLRACAGWMRGEAIRANIHSKCAAAS
jgi:hypothetical protein